MSSICLSVQWLHTTTSKLECVQQQVQNTAWCAWRPGSSDHTRNVPDPVAESVLSSSTEIRPVGPTENGFAGNPCCMPVRCSNAMSSVCLAPAATRNWTTQFCPNFHGHDRLIASNKGQTTLRYTSCEGRGSSIRFITYQLIELLSQ